MEKFILDTEVIVLTYNELNSSQLKLVETAFKACENSYSPYSEFSVGSSLEFENGEIFQANNQENAAYPSGLCAERTLLFYAKANNPHKEIKRMVIAAKNHGKATIQPVSPCGACRQVMLETANRQNSPIELLLAGADKVYMIKDVKTLLPLQFNAESLK